MGKACHKVCLFNLELSITGLYLPSGLFNNKHGEASHDVLFRIKPKSRSFGLQLPELFVYLDAFCMHYTLQVEYLV